MGTGYDRYETALDSVTTGDIVELYNAYKNAKKADDDAKKEINDATSKSDYRDDTEKNTKVQEAKDAQKITAQTLKEKKQALDNKIAELVSLKASIDAQDEIITDNTVAEDDINAHNTALTSATNDYNRAKQVSDRAESAYNTAQADADTAKLTYETAKEQYGVITNTGSDSTNVTIYINLENEVTEAETGKWQLLPTTVTDATVAEFYYNNILASGETSSRLIKSVEMADTVTQGSFKEFDFDLNVVVKSAQVVYDDANQITPKAAIDSIDGAKPSEDTYTLTDTITWVAN